MSAVEKQALRASMRAQRTGISPEEQHRLSCLLCEIVVSWYVYQQAKTVMLYAPVGRELDLMPLAQKGDKRFALPRMVGETQMEAALFCPGHQMVRGRYGFLAPVGPAVPLDEIDLILMPALACGLDGFRLGYGKGCYDRFLAQNALHAQTGAVVYDSALFETVAHDEMDVAAQFVITPTGVRGAGGGRL